MLSMMKKAGESKRNNNGFQLRQQRNKPIELYNNTIYDQKLEYLHNKPVVAIFVDETEDYLFSSARDYAGTKGLLSIKLIQ